MPSEPDSAPVLALRTVKNCTEITKTPTRTPRSNNVPRGPAARRHHGAVVDPAEYLGAVQRPSSATVHATPLGRRINLAACRASPR